MEAWESDVILWVWSTHEAYQTVGSTFSQEAIDTALPLFESLCRFLC